MTFKFSTYYPFPLTMVFEELYDEKLRFTVKDKLEFEESGGTFIYLIDSDTNKLIGETYYLPVDLIKDVDDDLIKKGLEPYLDKNAVYVYSNSILPEYQGKGYGTLLKSYLLGHLKSQNYNFTLGHARRSGSIQLNEKFGAKVVRSYDNWYGTGETVDLYIQTL